MKSTSSLRRLASKDGTLDRLKMDKKQMIFIEAISKHSSLVSVSVVSSIIVFAIITITALFRDHNTYEAYTIAILAPIDIVINIVCLGWQFSFWGSKYYLKYCKWVHKIYHKTAKKEGIKRMKTKHKSSLQVAKMTNVPSDMSQPSHDVQDSTQGLSLNPACLDNPLPTQTAELTCVASSSSTPRP